MSKVAEGFLEFRDSLDFVVSKGSQEYQHQLVSQEYQVCLAFVETEDFQDFGGLMEQMGYLENQVLPACLV